MFKQVEDLRASKSAAVTASNEAIMNLQQQLHESNETIQACLAFSVSGSTVEKMDGTEEATFDGTRLAARKRDECNCNKACVSVPARDT